MKWTTRSNRVIELAVLEPGDLDHLHLYLGQLGEETRKRFGPHGFSSEALNETYSKQEDHLGFIAREVVTGKIIAYAVVKIGCLEHDRERLASYGLELNDKTDCALAPSVADDWQGTGVGECLFGYILSQLRARGIQRIFLWGGVQADNHRAVAFYLKQGFTILGSFQYNGENHDMVYMVMH